MGNLARMRAERVIGSVALLAATLLAGCTTVEPGTASSGRRDSAGDSTCHASAGSALAPASGALLGVSIDWSKDTLAGFADRLGQAPAVAVTFAQMPLRKRYIVNFDAAAAQAAAVGSRLLLSLEPHHGLAKVTPAAIHRLTRLLRRYNGAGVPVIVRFAHEMNGSWYAWGQQPRAYVRTFRRVAAAVHRTAPGSSMLWAPSYGGGYPFVGGEHAATEASPAGREHDTNRDGRLDGRDDSYRPYYPGDRFVDWVGMSLYHWGTSYPWGENEVPVRGKLVDQLTRRYDVPRARESGVPDFYAIYGQRHRKPVAITETAALYAPGNGGASARAIKTRWWRQVFAPDLLERYPRIKMLNWFEWDKYEPEIAGRVDWTLTRDPVLRRAFARALPMWLVTGSGSPVCPYPSARP